MVRVVSYRLNLINYNRKSRPVIIVIVYGKNRELCEPVIEIVQPTSLLVRQTGQQNRVL